MSVIDFKAARSFVFKGTENREQRLCSHSNIIVCEETRTIECDKCGIILDPFDYLRKVCYQDEHAFQTHSTMLVEVEKLKKQYNRLSSEVFNLNLEKKQLKMI
jgi:methionyl-tRNA synthetase